jgi:hypothetical protein
MADTEMAEILGEEGANPAKSNNPDFGFAQDRLPSGTEEAYLFTGFNQAFFMGLFFLLAAISRRVLSSGTARPPTCASARCGSACR